VFRKNEQGTDKIGDYMTDDDKKWLFPEEIEEIKLICDGDNIDDFALAKNLIECRKMLVEHQFVPDDDGCHNICPECCRSERDIAGVPGGHALNCKLAKLLPEGK
jgi:hypothetical protein